MGAVTETPTLVEASATYAGEPDPVLAAAVDIARAAAEQFGGEAVGEHVGVSADGELLVTHGFDSKLPGYVGWRWAVSLVRAPEQDFATVADAVLLPGAGALLAPAWVPWSERLRPGDLGPGDLLQPDPKDPRLVPGYVADEDVQLRQVAFELGLGRERVMSRDGRLDIAQRWYDGEYGPDTPMARQAPARCGTCGFLLPLAGSLQAGFGVCGNEISSADGHAVSVEYGCGAHSQIKVKVAPLSEPVGEVYDDGDEVTIVVPGGPPGTGGVAAGGDGDEVEPKVVEPTPVVEPSEERGRAEITETTETTVTAEESADATLAAVLGHQDQADEAEHETVQADPEPAAVAVVIEPAEEDQAEHESDEPQGQTD